MGFPYFLGYFFLNENLPDDAFLNFEYPDRAAFVDYFTRKINKAELIERIKECYKDMPELLEINIKIIENLP